jgi:GNAT superfamily N-acetyltransferase
MDTMIYREDISIRTNLMPGDLGYITYLHGYYYKKEYNYGIQFESYVAEGLIEFYKNYDLHKDIIWICEHSGKMIGSLLMMHRDNKCAQLRYFLVLPAYRGIGLGKKLMSLFIDNLHKYGYNYSYLWTTSELEAASSLYKSYGFKLTEEKKSSTFGKLVTEQRYDLCIRAESEVNTSGKGLNI